MIKGSKIQLLKVENQNIKIKNYKRQKRPRASQYFDLYKDERLLNYRRITMRRPDHKRT